MARENYLSGGTSMLLLKLLENEDMYGYQIIEELAERSDDTFHMKTGTLYPILHGLENNGMVTSYEETAGAARVRKYYRITSKGRGHLEQKKTEWKIYAGAVNRVLDGGVSYGV